MSGSRRYHRGRGEVGKQYMGYMVGEPGWGRRAGAVLCSPWREVYCSETSRPGSDGELDKGTYRRQSFNSVG